MDEISRCNQSDIIFRVNCSNCNDSNKFLRVFYERLCNYKPLAWHFSTYRVDRLIHVGWAYFGEMWLSYEVRGVLNKVYISTYNEELHSVVSEALEYAQYHYNELILYNVQVLSRGIPFHDMSKNNIKIESIKKDNEFYSKISFLVYAFGKYDIEYIAYQKVNYLKHLLCAYTNRVFHFLKVEVSSSAETMFLENVWPEPDNEWVDDDDVFRLIEGTTDFEIVLSYDFFDLFRIVLDNSEYDRRIRLILNSAQELYCAKLLSNEVDKYSIPRIPGIVDIINTTTVSALEPLSCLEELRIEKCRLCGNNVYSIVKRVKSLCKKYLPEIMVKYLIDRAYAERSKFLHEGYATTTEFRGRRSTPLLNPIDGRSVLNGSSSVDINLFEYVTYVFRAVVNEEITSRVDSP